MVILKFISPGRVEVWEAVLTVFFLPVICVTCYATEKGFLDPLFCIRKNRMVLTHSINFIQYLYFTFKLLLIHIINIDRMI